VLEEEQSLDRQVRRVTLRLVKRHRPRRRFAQPVAGVGVTEPELVVPVRVGNLGRIKDLPHRVEQRTDAALEGEVRVGEAKRVLPGAHPVGRRLAACDQVGDESNELAHRDVPRAGSDEFQQGDQPLAHLRLAQRIAVGKRRIGNIEAGEEAILRETVDDPLDDARRQQVAQA
jgi:hypothetical protein